MDVVSGIAVVLEIPVGQTGLVQRDCKTKRREGSDTTIDGVSNVATKRFFLLPIHKRRTMQKDFSVRLNANLQGRVIG